MRRFIPVHPTGDDIEFMLLGALSQVGCALLGWIDLTDAVNTAAFAAIGASVSWLVKFGWDELAKPRLKKLFAKKDKNETPE
jgi:hypothetical protein